MNFMSQELNNNIEKAKTLWDKKLYNEALEIALNNAEKGHLESQIFVGNVYLNGVGSIEQNLHESVKWLEMSVKSDSVVGHYLLGIAYYYLLDYTKALNEFVIASEMKYFAADYQIGKMYYYGIGVPMDIEQSYKYFLAAKKQGHMFASRQVAVILMKGHKGFINIFRGMFLFIMTIFRGFFVALKNPDSEKLFD